MSDSKTGNAARFLAPCRRRIWGSVDLLVVLSPLLLELNKMYIAEWGPRRTDGTIRPGAFTYGTRFLTLEVILI